MLIVGARTENEPVGAAFPGSNGKIAFETDRDDNFEVYAMVRDGSGLTSLTNTPAFDGRPSWQPLASPSQPGDANCDAVSDALDALVVLQFEASLIESLACQQNADVNGDGAMTAVDATFILQFDVGLLVSLALGGAAGIEGLVTIGPMCPVLRVDTPCPDQPFETTIVVETEDGDEVATVHSGADGRFQITLTPGRYTLVPQSPNPGGPPMAGEQVIEVEVGSFTQVTIQYDSGIR